ncbi:ammonium transporter [Rubritalea spongiae]
MRYLLIMLMMSSAAIAQEATAEAVAQVSESAADSITLDMNLLFVFVCAGMVFLMQAGFCLLELGYARSKSCLNVVMKNATDICVAVILYFVIGFGIMFGASKTGWFGTELPWISDFSVDSPIWMFLLFQSMFVGTAATIVSGALAERAKFMGYLVFSAVLSGLIYPISGHWAWGNLSGGLVEGFGYVAESSESSGGWLADMGFIDFAGSTVVHAVGGAAALAGIIVIGARKGRFAEDGTPKLVSGHNKPLVALGTLILWFGWFGFNGGSALEINASVGRITFNTLLAGCAGGLSGMICYWGIQGRPSPSALLNGILAGCAAITAGCANVTPISAVLIGLIGGIVAIFVELLLLKAKLDDVVGAVPVHLGAGVWGTIAVAIFHEGGFSYNQLWVQTLGTFIISAYAFGVSFLTFKLIGMTIGIRTSEDEEAIGLDFAEHASSAYPEFSTNVAGELD